MNADNLHLVALINSYWYYAAMLPNLSNELDRINLSNVMHRTARRIYDIMEKG